MMLAPAAALLCVGLAAAPATAAEAAPDTPTPARRVVLPMPPPPAPHLPRADLPRVGVQLDAGVPDGAGLSVVVRPLRALQAHAGVVTHGGSAGGRLGLTWVPFAAFVRPTLTLEAGHYLPGDFNRVARLALRRPDFQSGLLERIHYDFANAHLGLEVGSQRVAFSLRGGLSYMAVSAPGERDVELPGDGGRTTVDGARLRLTLPSLKLGFAVFFG